MKKREEVKFYGLVSSTGASNEMQNAIHGVMYQHANGRGITQRQVQALKKKIQEELDNMEICSEVMHTHGRGGYEFVTCMGVKLTLHPYAPCEL